MYGLYVIIIQAIEKKNDMLYFLIDFFLTFAVRAGTGGDEAGLWAGDLVGTCFSYP